MNSPHGQPSTRKCQAIRHVPAKHGQKIRKLLFERKEKVSQIVNRFLAVFRSQIYLLPNKFIKNIFKFFVLIFVSMYF